MEYFVEIGWTIFCVRFKEKKSRHVTFLCCMVFFLHFYSCTRSGYCLLVSRQTGIGFWSHSERHQVRKRSKLLYHFKHCKDLWSADGSLDRYTKVHFQYFLILHYIIKVWRGHFFNHLAGALMCGVGCVAALGYCVLDMIGSRKLDKNHVFNIKSQPLVRDELKYFIDIIVILFFP